MKKLLFTLFTALFALNVAAQSTPTSGEIGNITWHWDAEKKTITLTGSGEIPNFDNNISPWHKKYTVTIPEFGIQTSMSYCQVVTTINIQEGIRSIGSNAFSGCTALTTINVHGSVTSIGSNAFSGCTALTTINVPGSVEDYGTGVFSGCSSLTYAGEHIIIKADSENLAGDTYTVPASIKYIEAGAFNECSAMRYLIYEGYTQVGGDIANSEVTSNITTTVVPNNWYNSFSASHGPNRNQTSVYVKKDKYTSYAFLHNVTVPKGVVAYTATTDGSVVTLHPITAGNKIKAGEGVFLKSTADNTYKFINGDGAEKVEGNVLQGELKARTLLPEDNAYVMQTKEGVQKFYKVDADLNLARFKAWLKLDYGTGAKIFSIFDEYTTDIEDTEEEAEDPVNSRAQVYNIAGQKLSAPQKGLNIINGKIIIK